MILTMYLPSTLKYRADIFTVFAITSLFQEYHICSWLLSLGLEMAEWVMAWKASVTPQILPKDPKESGKLLAFEQDIMFMLKPQFPYLYNTRHQSDELQDFLFCICIILQLLCLQDEELRSKLLSGS